MAASPEQARPRVRAFLDTLPDGQRDALLRSGSAGRMERAEILVRDGDPAHSAFVLLAGHVKIHKSNREGTEVVLELLGPGDLLGEVAIARDAFRSATVTALDAVEHVVIPVTRLRAYFVEHPTALFALLDLTLARLHRSNARRIEYATSGSLARVASRLVELAERFGTPQPDGAIDVKLPITQDELASWSSSSRESTARALRTLRTLHLIETNRRQLIVKDLNGLSSHGARL